MKLTIEVTKEPGITTDLWVSHCIELDVISQAAKPEISIEAVAEAVRMVLQHEMKRRGMSCAEAFGAIAAEVAARGKP